MRKIFVTGLGLAAASLTACTPATTTPSQSSAPSPSVIASAPNASQLKELMRDWHNKGGDRVQVPLTVDLELAQNDWRGDQFKRQVLVDSMNKDVKAAMTYRSIPDEEMQQHWASFLQTMKMVSDNLNQGNYDKAAQGFKDADQEYKKVYDRNQAIFNQK